MEYPQVQRLQSQLEAVNKHLEQVVDLCGKLTSQSRKDDIKLLVDAIHDNMEANSHCDQLLLKNGAQITSELDRLLLKEDETDSSLKLRRQLQHSGSGVDAESLRKQIEEQTGRIVEAQNARLVLETRLAEKDRQMKALEDSLTNMMADMKHIRAETQKTVTKHEKRTKDAESRVNSMASELKRANETMSKYKMLYEAERKRGKSGGGNQQTERASTTPSHLNRRASTVPRGASSPSPAAPPTIDEVDGSSAPAPAHKDSQSRKPERPTSGAAGSKSGQSARDKPAAASANQSAAPAPNTCLNVEELIRKNQQYMEEAGSQEDEVKMWRTLFHNMVDKTNAYNAEMLRCQGEVATLHEERIDLKNRLNSALKQNALMRRDLEKNAETFVEYKRLQFKLSEEIKWSKLKPLGPTKIYSRTRRPHTNSKSREINVESWNDNN